jgi:acyl-CoA synthetase (AMP-forming)/AMP-acid ligase II
MLEEPPAKMKQDMLLHELVNYNMLHHGSGPMFTFHDAAIASNVSISFLEFGRACHRLAHFIRPSRIGKDGEVVAIVAHLDNVFYHAITIGVMLAGWIVSGSN